MLVNTNESETDLQKHVVKLIFQYEFCILAKNGINYCYCLQDFLEPLGSPGCLPGASWCPLERIEAIEAGKVPPGFFRKYKKVPPGFFRKYKNPL